MKDRSFIRAAASRMFARWRRARASVWPESRSWDPRPIMRRLSSSWRRRRATSSPQRLASAAVSSPGTARVIGMRGGSLRVRAMTRPVQPRARASPKPATSSSPMKKIATFAPQLCYILEVTSTLDCSASAVVEAVPIWGEEASIWGEEARPFGSEGRPSASESRPSSLENCPQSAGLGKVEGSVAAPILRGWGRLHRSRGQAGLESAEDKPG